MDINFKTKEHPEAKTVTFDMPETFEGLVGKFGEDAVASAARGAFVISLQAYGRRHIEKDQDEIQTLISNWNPNERAAAVRQTPLEKVTSGLAKLSPEEKADLLARLQAAA